jgi:hypothetical protein
MKTITPELIESVKRHLNHATFEKSNKRCLAGTFRVPVSKTVQRSFIIEILPRHVIVLVSDICLVKPHDAALKIATLLSINFLSKARSGHFLVVPHACSIDYVARGLLTEGCILGQVLDLILPDAVLAASVGLGVERAVDRVRQKQEEAASLEERLTEVPPKTAPFWN